jgi:hypothetical protein
MDQSDIVPACYSHPPGIGVTGMAVCVVGLHLAGAFVRPLKAIGYRWNEAVDALRSRVEGACT